MPALSPCNSADRSCTLLRPVRSTARRTLHRPGDLRVFRGRKPMTAFRSAVQALVVLALTTAIFPPPLAAQGSTGRIDGVVRDEQQGTLPGVLVTLRNQQTGVVRTMTSENDGRYDFS